MKMSKTQKILINWNKKLNIWYNSNKIFQKIMNKYNKIINNYKNVKIFNVTNYTKIIKKSKIN